jgi:Cd2+/Zn2+-exporting ATPase
MGLTLLVVSCPCALVISTPVAIVAAIGSAARSGVLIKGGAHLETLGDISIVAFDKTGTLTVGKPSVCDVIPFNSHTRQEVLSAAAAVESRSEHPLAEAIIREARASHACEQHVSFFEAMPGKGARAVINGGVIYVGSRRLLEELSIDVPGTTEIARLVVRGCTVVYVADENELWGAIGASDTLRRSSAEAIAGLKKCGVRQIVMLTGDTMQTARAVAEQLGIDSTYAELLPQDKAAKISELGAGGDKVAMVGDGINDAPALAAADVGIAMGGVGSHTAIETADVALMADDIVMLPYGLTISRKARGIIRQNVVFAVLVVVLLVAGALLKWVNLATGVLGHEGSALAVIANSMRLLKRRKSIGK